MTTHSVLALTEAFESYKIEQNVAAKNLCVKLDELSKELASDPAFRQELPNNYPRLWSHVSGLWVTALSGFETRVSSNSILSLARFTRNLVAGVPRNQEAAFVSEPQIRGLLHRLSSFSLIEDNNLYPLTRMLVQTLSNLITLNDTLAMRLWTLYMTLPEDRNIIVRLLASPDSQTVISTLVLILNCIKMDDEGLKRLTSPTGLRILVMLLDRTETWVDKEDESVESEGFTLAYRIFEALLDQDFGATLYHNLSIEDEPITPHQTTFLKILDSYTRHQDEQVATAVRRNGHLFLTEAFVDLCSHCQRSIRRFLGLGSAEQSVFSLQRTSSDPDDRKELDMCLPKISAALILVSQSLTTMCLKDAKNPGAHSDYVEVSTATQADEFIENLVETLRLVDRFLPRIVFGEAAIGPGRPDHKEGRHADATGFVYLKRDLVRLLGTICQERKGIQDKIRGCGGIPVVMNLCVIDERNPYLQEHAVFALRNILYRNPDNQRIVDAMSLQQG